MTAINITIGPDGITIYSDGATYDDEGICRLLNQKVNCLMHIPVMVASRGSGRPGATIGMEISTTCHTFDDVVANIAEIVRRNSIDACVQWGDPVNLSYTTAGWSERDQEYQAYFTWIFATDDDNLDDIKAETIRIDSYRLEPSPDWDLVKECGLLVDNSMTLGTDENWIKFMECQRGTAYLLGPICPDKIGSIVGGFIQKTFFQRDASVTAIIHRWPDKIGEPINAGAVLRYQEKKVEPSDTADA